MVEPFAYRVGRNKQSALRRPLSNTFTEAARRRDVARPNPPEIARVWHNGLSHGLRSALRLLRSTNGHSVAVDRLQRLPLW